MRIESVQREFTQKVKNCMRGRNKKMLNTREKGRTGARIPHKKTKKRKTAKKN